MTSRSLSRSSFFRHPGWLVVAAFALSCIGDAAAPGVARPALLQLAPYFQNEPPRGIVRVDRIRIVLVRPGETRAALDTTVKVTPGDSVLDLKLTVPVYTAADTFSAELDMLDAQGTVVFHGGPIIVVAIATQRSDTPPPATPLEIRYVGVGANATSVEITPTVIPGVFTGDTTVLTAVARTAEGTEIPGTPVGWTSLDTAIARVPDLIQGRVVGRLQRGSARVVAQLVTGQADTVLVPVKLLPASMVIVGGSGQTGVVRSLLLQAIVARVKASDSLAVSAVWVKFQVTSGGGTTSSDSSLTDVTGHASVEWTLGQTAGAQAMLVTIPKVTGLQATAAATAIAGPAATLSLAGLTSPVVAIGATFSVKAKDQFGNTATAYRGTVHFTSTDQLAVLPADYTFTAGDAGLHTFTDGVTFGTSGNQTLTATDVVTSSITGGQSISVGAGAGGVVATFAITGLPGSLVAGVYQPITVTAKDAGGNTVTNYAGTVGFTSNDLLAVLPAPYTFLPGDNGVRTFTTGVAFGTAGARTVTVTDQAQGTITGTSAPVTVGPTSVLYLDVTGVADSTVGGIVHTRPGVAFSVTVTPRDSFLNLVTGYNGTVTFTAPADLANPVLPAPYTFIPATDQGVHTFAGGVTLNTPGTQAILVEDQNEVPGFLSVMVAGGPPATQLAFVAPPANTVAGAVMAPVAIAALDATGAPTGYTGDITVAIGTNPATGTLSGTTTVAAINGIAVFADLSINNVGSGYTLVASATGLTGVTSPPFDIIPFVPTVHWTGAGGDGLWGTVSNWDSLRIPLPTEVADVSLAGIYTVTLNQNVTIAGLQLGAATGTQTLQISGTTLTVNGSGSVGGNGIISLAGGALAGSGSLTIDGALNWTGGNLNGAGSTYVTGTLTIDGSATKFIDSRALIISGTATWLSTGTGIVYLQSAGQIVTEPDATLELRAVSSIGNNGGAGPVTNGGILARTSSGGVFDIGVAFSNEGTVDVQTGTLTLSGGGSSGGDFITQSVLAFSGGTHNISPTSSVTGAGEVRFSNGTASLSGTYNVGITTVIGGTVNFDGGSPAATNSLSLSAGAQGGSGILNVATVFAWSGGNLTGSGTTHVNVVTGSLSISGSATKFIDARVLENAGAVTWLPSGTGTVYGQNGATISNLAGAIWDNQANSSLGYNGGTFPVFVNAGALSRTAGTGTFTHGFALNNSGTVDVGTGTMSFTGGGTSSGTFIAEAGAVLAFAGSTQTTTASSAFSGGGEIRFTSGTVIVGGLYTVSSTNVNGGTANFNVTTPATTGSLALSSGTQGGTGTLNVSGNFTWSGGDLAGTGVTHVNPTTGTLTITGSGSKFIGSRTLENAGTATWLAAGTGTLYSQNGGTISNLATGTWDVQVISTLGNNGSPGPFNNAGTLTRTVSTGLFTHGIAFNNTGSVNVQTGTMTFAAGGASSGSFAVQSGAVLAFSGGTQNADASSSFTGAGEVRFASGITNLAGTYTVTGLTSATGGAGNFNLSSSGSTGSLSVSAGSQGGSGTLNVTGNFTWSGGDLTGTGVTHVNASTGTMTITGLGSKFLDTRTLENAGTATWIPAGTGIVYFMNGGTIDNLAGATFDLQANGTFGNNGSPGPFTNAGSLARTVGTGTHTFSVQFTNAGTGTVDVQTGVLHVNAGSDWTGPATIAAGAELRHGGGAHVIRNGFGTSGAGFLGLASGIDTVVAGATVNLERVTVSGAVLTGPGTVVIDNALTWTNGNMRGTGLTQIAAPASLTIDAANSKFLIGRTLENVGTATWLATGIGTLYFQAGGTIHNLGTFDLQANAMIADNGTPGPFLNDGAVTRTTSTGIHTIDVPFINTGTGTLAVQTGILDMSSGGTWTGPVTIASGAELRHSAGAHVLNNGFDISGLGFAGLTGGVDTVVTGATVHIDRATMSGATLAGPGTVVFDNELTWTSGNMQGSGITQIAAPASLTISAVNSKFLIGRTLENAGTATWTGTGTVYFQAGGTINNLDGATFEFRADGMIADNGAPGPFLNAGAVTRTTSTGIHTIDVPFTNTGTGTLAVQTGILDMSSGGTWTGPVTIASGAELRHSAGAHVLNNGFDISGLGFAGLTGGVDTVVTGATVHIDRATLSGAALAGPGTVVFDNVLTWTNGTMRGTGVTQIAAPASLTIDAANSKFLIGRTLENVGTATWLATGIGTLYFQGGGSISNLGTFDFRANGTIADNTSPGTFTNSGTVKRTVSTGIMLIDIPVVNTASSITSVESGTLSYTNTLNHQDNAILQGTGTVNLSAATVTMNGDINPGIPLTAGGTLSITGNLTLGSAGEINIEVSSPTVYDVLAISGVATLDGTLLIEGTYPLATLETLSLAVITYGSNPGPSTLASVITSLLNGSISLPPTYGSTSVTAFVVGL